MKKALILIALFLYLTGCSEEKPVGDYPVIDVLNSIGKYQRVYCSDFFSSIELIPLETEKECLLLDDFPPASILKDSLIFMRGDERTNIRLYAFDWSGKFLNQIGERGQGPGEYITLLDVFLNPDNLSIIVTDVYKLLEYDFSGKFIRSFRKPNVDGVSLSRCFYVEDNLFVGQINYDGKRRNKYCLFNQHGETVVCFPSHVFFDRVGTFAQTSDAALPPVRVDDRLYLKDFVNDTIYLLANSNLQPAYVFRFGKYSFPIEYLESQQTPSVPLNTFLLMGIGIVGTPTCFFYEIRVPDVFSRPKAKPLLNPYTDQYISTDPVVYGIYNISQNTNILLDTDSHLQKGIINDMNGGLSFFPKYYAGDNVVIDVWKAWEMKEMLTEEYFAKQPIKDQAAHQQLREILKNLKDDDNPVIVIAKLK